MHRRTWEVVSLENRDSGTDDCVVFPVDGTKVKIHAIENVREGPYISLIEIMLSIFVIPSQ